MVKSKYLPNINRVSILASAILLVYTLAGFITLPTRVFSIQLPGLFLEFQLNTNVIIALLVSGMTATGADWLIREHPSFKERYSIQHWFIPALTAWAIGTILFQQPFSILWWVTFAIGGGTLTLVLIAEYITVDLDDVRRIPAIIGLTAIAFALFLTLSITIRAAEIRLFLLLPTITLAIFLTCLRTFHLRLQKKWVFLCSGVISIIIGEISAALNYLNIDPVSFGLILLGPAYALSSFVGGLLEHKNWKQTIIEPVFVLLIVWSVAVLIH